MNGCFVLGYYPNINTCKIESVVKLCNSVSVFVYICSLGICGHIINALDLNIGFIWKWENSNWSSGIKRIDTEGPEWSVVSSVIIFI